MSSPTAEPIDGIALDLARRRQGIERWRRHSRLIHLWRMVLPGMIGVVCLVLAGFVIANTLIWRIGATNETKGMSIRMVNPKFLGRNSSNAPFVISARSATRDDQDFKRVMLDHPVFTTNAGQPDQATLTADYGVYREDTGMLDLQRNIVLTDLRGYHFTTQKALVDTHQRDVLGNSPATGYGPLGRISSSSYGVDQGGQRIFFKGQVKTRIEQPQTAIRR